MAPQAAATEPATDLVDPEAAFFVESEAELGELLGDSASAGSASPSAPLAIDPYIIAYGAYKCLEVAGGGAFNGANIWQWDCDGDLHQRWTLQYAGGGAFYLVARHSNKCAEVAWGSEANGANIWQWDCNAEPHQRWRLRYAGSGYFYLVAQHSNKCMEVAFGSAVNGANVWQWECDGDQNQIWLVRW